MMGEILGFLLVIGLATIPAVAIAILYKMGVLK